MQKPFAAAAVAALVASFGAPAQADIWSRASIDKFGYRLVDLRPEDGIAPKIRFNSTSLDFTGGTLAGSYASENDTPFDWMNFNTEGDDFKTFKPMAVEAATPTVEASARLYGSLARHGFGMVAKGSLLNSVDETDLKQFSAGASSAQPGRYAFEVTPFTRVIFTGTASLQTGRSGWDDGVLREIGTASFYASIAEKTDYIMSYSREIQVDSEASEVQESFIQRFRVDYNNRTAARAPGQLYLNVQVEGVTILPRPTASVLPPMSLAPVSPVPESSTAVLMLCGFGVVGVMVRTARRRENRERYRAADCKLQVPA